VGSGTAAIKAVVVIGRPGTGPTDRDTIMQKADYRTKPPLPCDQANDNTTLFHCGPDPDREPVPTNASLILWNNAAKI